jgi:predicted DNA-binding transcriptional regulator AlpA
MPRNKNGRVDRGAVSNVAYALLLVTRQQLAKEFNTTEETLCRMDAEGIGPPFVRLGKRMIRYRRCDIDAWLAQQSRP